METIRRLARRVIGGKSPAYKKIARTFSSARVVGQEGFAALHRLDHVRHAPPGNLVPISMKTLQHPIYMRTGSNDPEVVIQNAVRDEWGFALRASDRPKTMIDGGAFIGDTAAVFLTRYPALQMVAVEPDSANYAVANKNLAPYGDRVRLVKAAMWHEPAMLDFGGKSWGARFSEYGVSTNEKVEAIPVVQLLDMLPGGRADILKLDVEGAEMGLFENQPERWLDRVGIILIELHSPAIEQVILPIARAHGFSTRQCRAAWAFRRD